jgi:hypothetical protein
MDDSGNTRHSGLERQSIFPRSGNYLCIIGDYLGFQSRYWRAIKLVLRLNR